MWKFVVAFILLVTLLIYKFRQDQRIKNLRVEKKQLQSFKLKKSRRQFENKIGDVCGNTDDCQLSAALVNTVANMVKQDGLKNTVRYMRNNREKFITDDGEYVWIHAYDENDGYYYIYHHYSLIDGLGVNEAQNNINKGYCNVELCNIEKTLHGIVQLLKNSSQGYYSYNWYSPITKQVIKKRSFVRKLRNIEDRKKKRSIYIGSGATIDNIQRRINWNVIWIYVASFAFFSLIWYLIDVDAIMGNSAISQVIFSFILVVYLFNIFNFDTIRLDTDASLRAMYVSYFSNAISTSLITLALAIFLFRVLKISSKETKKLSTQLLCISIIFSFLCFIEVSLKDSEENLNIKIALKQSFGLNCIGFILITILFVYFNLKE